MRPNPSVESFDDALARAKRTERLRLWAFAVLWVSGALVLLILLWKWSRDLDYVRNQLSEFRNSMNQLEVRAEGLKSNSADLDRRVREAAGSASQARQDVDATQLRIRKVSDDVNHLDRNQKQEQGRATQLTQELHKKLAELQNQLDALKAEAAKIESDLPGFQGQIAGLAKQTGDLSMSFAASLQRANDKLATLESAAKDAETKLRGIERELQTGHYVFTAHTEFRVWGMDIFVRFGRWRKAESGLDNFCVSATSNGPCLFGPAFLPLGRTIEVLSAPYRYRITARYGVGMLFAHDQVGFDVNRELIKE